MKTVTTSLQLDADICNLVDSPIRGCTGSVGLQVNIPADWQSRILAGQTVPGCSYHKLDPVNGVLIVSDKAIAQLLIPAVVSSLTAGQQTEVVSLNAKLAAAAVQGN